MLKCACSTQTVQFIISVLHRRHFWGLPKKIRNVYFSKVRQLIGKSTSGVVYIGWLIFSSIDQNTCGFRVMWLAACFTHYNILTTPYRMHKAEHKINVYAWHPLSFGYESLISFLWLTMHWYNIGVVEAFDKAWDGDKSNCVSYYR